MAKITESMSGYLKTDVCEECDWFAQPIRPFKRDCCPKCGGDIYAEVGRFNIVKTKTIFKTETKYTGFVKKNG